MLQYWGRVHHKENTVRTSQESTVMEKTDTKNCQADRTETKTVSIYQQILTTEIKTSDW